MVLFVLRTLILQMRMCSHPVGLNVWFLVGPFIYFHTSCVRTAKALVETARMHRLTWASLVAYVISTIISWAGSFYDQSPQKLCGQAWPPTRNLWICKIMQFFFYQKRGPPRGFREQGNKGNFFRETGEQRPKNKGNRGTQTILGNREHRKSRFCFWGTRPFFSRGTGIRPGRASETDFTPLILT